MSILVVTYVSPIITIGTITIHMAIVLWWRQPLCIITPQLERAKQKKQKVVVLTFSGPSELQQRGAQAETSCAL